MSMKPTSVRFRLTSFGPFLDVVDNPSQHIGRQLESLLAHKDGVELLSHATLEVSMEAVDAYFTQTTTALTAAARSATVDDTQQKEEGCVFEVLVHLGVHRGAKGEIRLELRGVNDLHCPQGDFQGVQVDHCPIVVRSSAGEDGGEPTVRPVPASSFKESSPLTQQRAFDALETTIPAVVLQSAMQLANESSTAVQEEGRCCASLVTSIDAGRYLCNFCYCRSLHLTSTLSAQREGLHWASLFIHVLDPQDENPSVVQQARCIAEFLVQLARLIREQ